VDILELHLQNFVDIQFEVSKIDIKKLDILQQKSLLEEIKDGRKTFDNSETEIGFGSSIVVDYRMVQVKINNKYDSWHKEILNQFGVTFNENLKTFFSNICNLCFSFISSY